jgi:acetoin utilization deacetylase AcuC-like enzyme
MLERLRARHRLLGRVRIWYHPEYAPALIAHSARVEGLDPRRGERILIELVEQKLIAPRDVRRAPIASVGDLLRFHPLSYLEASADRDQLAHVFGLPPEEVDVDGLLRAQRRAVGGTIEAAQAAVHTGSMYAINLGGGFHHAEPEMGAGFCVYNDIGVAIGKLRAQGFDKRIAIVDLDYHQGNGNTVAYERDDSVFVFSIHGSVWTRVEGQSAGKEVHLTNAVDDDKYLSCLRTLLPAALKELSPRLIFYIAGNDVLAGDRLGTFSLTPEGVLERDAFVLELAKSLDAPLVVTLGGGYSEHAWRSTLHLVRCALTDERKISPPKHRDLRTDFSRIAHQIDPIDLVGDSLDLTEEDLVAALERRPISRRVLGYYSAEGVEFALERYGILPEIRKRGWAELAVELDLGQNAPQLLRVRGRKRARAPMSTLVELVVSRTFIDVPDSPDARSEVLHIEWMLLEDPSKSFTLAKPRLPGQNHPGLGLALEMQELLVQACHRLSLGGLSQNPAHYHNALGAQGFFFLDAEVEGRFRAMAEVLREVAIADASFIVEEGRLRFDDGSVCAWNPALHVLPLDERLRAYFASEPYRARARDARKSSLARGLRAIT